MTQKENPVDSANCHGANKKKAGENISIVNAASCAESLTITGQDPLSLLAPTNNQYIGGESVDSIYQEMIAYLEKYKSQNLDTDKKIVINETEFLDLAILLLKTSILLSDNRVQRS